MKHESPRWIETAAARLALLHEGLVWVAVKPGIDQTPHMAHENVDASIRLAGGTRRPLLIDLRGAVPLEPETRRVYMDKSIGAHFSRIAMVILTDRLSRMMAGVYMVAARLPIPVRVFTDAAKAADWLVPARRLYKDRDEPSYEIILQ